MAMAMAATTSLLPRHPHKPQPKPNTKPFSNHTATTSLRLPDFPSPTDYALAINSCSCSILAPQIHAHVIKRRFTGHSEFLDTRILAMYGRCCSPHTARYLFDRMPQRTIYTWVAIFTVLVNHRLFRDVLGLFRQMLAEEIELNFYVFPVVLKACSGIDSVELGKCVHGFVVKKGIVSNVYVGNALIDMYGKCGFVEDAIEFFNGMIEKDNVSWNSIITSCSSNGMVYKALEYLEQMSDLIETQPDVVSWSSAINGFAQNGHDGEALKLFARMVGSGVQPNSQTFSSVLPICGRLGILKLAKELHGYVIRHDLIHSSFVVNGLMDVYWRCGDITSSEQLFMGLSPRNVVSYNTLIIGYFETGKLDEAKEMFERIELDGLEKDDISWNSIISGYVDYEMNNEAIRMFRRMIMDEKITPNQYHLGSVILACAASGACKPGKELHSHAIVRGFASDSFVGSALVELYCKCKDLTAAESVFIQIQAKTVWNWNVLSMGHARNGNFVRAIELVSQMKLSRVEPNIHTWNGLIAGCMENGENKLAFEIFRQLPGEGVTPDIHTIGMVLPICSRALSIELGKQVHAYTIRSGYDSEVRIGAPLVDMYCKCGNINSGIVAFERIAEHNLVSWNTMLAGYATHGLGNEGIRVFEKLLKDINIMPNEITFLSVLMSCVHIGDVQKGYSYFKLMQKYGIKPDLKHYTCIIDLLSRTGRLYEAFELIQTMPIEPDAFVWSALLNGCITRHNLELGEIAGGKLIELEGDNMANYVMLANLYASGEKWNELGRIRGVIREKGMSKSAPGCSWIELRGTVHMFVASEKSFEEMDEIYEVVGGLHMHMREDDHEVICGN